MFCQGFTLHDLIFLLFNFFELTVFLDFSFDHPDIKFLFLGTKPIADSFLQFGIIFLKKISRAFFAPTNNSREVVAGS